MPLSSTNSVKVGSFLIETSVSEEALVAETNQHHSAVIVKIADLSQDTVSDGVLIGKGEVATIRTADCVPFILVGEAYALAVHISRKNIVDMFDTIRTFFPTVQPTQAYVGPHICAHHFTFSRMGEELESLKQSAPGMVHILDDELTHVDLDAGIRGFLRGIDISPKATFFDPRCTYETKNLPSYRRQYDTGEAWLGNLFTTVHSLK